MTFCLRGNGAVMKAGFLKNLIFRHYDLFLIVVVGMIPLLWFKPGCLIAGSDYSSFLNPILFNSLYLFPWSVAGAGTPNITSSVGITYFLFFYFLEKMVPLVVAEKVWFVAFFMLAGLSMRYMIRTIFSLSDVRLWSLSSALFYMVNFFMITTKTAALSVNGFYACTPLLIAFLYNIFMKKRPLKYSVLMALSTLLFAAGAVNPPATVVFLSVLLVFVCFLHFIPSVSGKRVTGWCYVAVSIVGGVALNLWWILPFCKLIFAYKEFAAYVPIYWNPASEIKATLFLGGAWSWGDYYYPISYRVYQLGIVKHALYVIPALAFIGLLFNKKERSHVMLYFFYFMAFAGIFLMKGRGGVGGGVFEYLFNHFPGFWMFREPYAKFGVLSVFGYAVTIGFSVQYLYNRVKAIHAGLSRAVVYGILSAVLLAGWPTFTSYYIDQPIESFASVCSKIPEYWHKAARFISMETGEFRLFEMPENKSCYTTMGWENGFSGAKAEQCIYEKPVVTSSIYDPAIIQYYYYMLRDYRYGVARRLFQLLNVKYIYQRNDFMWSLYGGDHPGKATDIIQRRLGLKKVRSFGRLDVYDTGSEPALIHLKDSVDIVLGGFRSLAALSCTDLLDSAALYFWGQEGRANDSEMLTYARRIVFFQGDTEEWLMRMLAESCRFEPEKSVGWSQYDYLSGWVPRSNFFGGEWLQEEDQKTANGNFFEGGGAVFTASKQPIAFSLPCRTGGLYSICIKKYQSDKVTGGDIRLDGRTVDAKPSSAAGAGMRWFCAKEVMSAGMHALQLANSAEKALVDSVLVYNEKDFEDVLKHAEFIMRDKEAVYLFEYDGAGTHNSQFRVFHDASCRISVQSDFDRAIELNLDGVAHRIERGSEESKAGIPVFLAKGMHVISVVADAKPVCVKIASQPFNPDFRIASAPFKRYGPSRLVVGPFQIAQPMVFVFNEKFHPGWKAYRLKYPEKYHTGFYTFLNVFHGRLEHTEIKEHFMLNGYANGFYLPASGTYNILLEFAPQNDYDIGLLISLVAGVPCILLVLFLMLKRLLKSIWCKYAIRSILCCSSRCWSGDEK